jgi:hypothetical protein
MYQQEFDLDQGAAMAQALSERLREMPAPKMKLASMAQKLKKAIETANETEQKTDLLDLDRIFKASSIEALLNPAC